MADVFGDGRGVQDTIFAVREWLAATPDANALLANLPALELAAHVKNKENGVFWLSTASLERLNAQVEPDSLENATLAALVELNVHAWQATGDTEFRIVSERLIESAKMRFNAEQGFFRANVTDTTDVMLTDGNAALGRVFYLAWQALDDQSLRPIAGTILGLVSDLFDPHAGLFQRKPMPDGESSETDSLTTYAQAICLFLTASATTGRGTYHSRACIVANFAVTNGAHWAASESAQLAFADALLRLYHVVNVPKYRQAAQAILGSIQMGQGAPPGILAQYALAQMRLTNP